MKKRFILIIAALLLGCGETGKMDTFDVDPTEEEATPEFSGEANEEENAPELTGEAELDADESENPLEESITLQSGDEQSVQDAAVAALRAELVPSTRLLVKITRDGDYEILNAVESRGFHEKTAVISDLMYQAEMDGEVLSVGTLHDPFTLHSANDPADGLGGLIERDEAIVSINLTGISLSSRFDLSISKLTQDPKVENVTIENAARVLRDGLAETLAKFDREEIATTFMQVGQVSDALSKDMLDLDNLQGNLQQVSR